MTTNKPHLFISVTSTMKALVIGRISPEDLRKGFFFIESTRTWLFDWLKNGLSEDSEVGRMTMSEIERFHTAVGDNAVRTAHEAIELFITSLKQAGDNAFLWSDDGKETLGHLWNALRPYMTDAPDDLIDVREHHMSHVGPPPITMYVDLFRPYGVQVEFFISAFDGQVNWY